MAKNRSIALIIFVLLSCSGFAQKIKYKDLFTLLSNRQYELAEPVLKNYLKETTDNPNAYLYMGIIYKEKSLKDDILRNTSEALGHMDSAILYFDKAFKMIDEKELKKNKDYYAMYNRRDLRSGEFGVKISDVQYEIETSKSELKERIDKVGMIKHYFTQSEALYKRSNELFISIQGKYSSDRELYLRADDQSQQELRMLSARFDSCAKAFDHYKSALSNLSKSGYNQAWNPVEIKDFKKDGVEPADFYQSNPLIWDYKRFAEGTTTTITKEIIPLREKLIKYDIEINKLGAKLASDSVSVKSDLIKLIDNLLADRLTKFDPDPLPLNVLSVKVAKLEYQSTLLENKKEKSSDDISIKINLIQKEISEIKKLDSLASKLMNKPIEQEALNYADFVSNTYSNASLLKGYVQSEKEFAERELANKNHQLESLTYSLNWLVIGNDSIPLNPDYKKSKFKPLVIEDKKFTAGIIQPDTTITNGYFYTITPSRKPDVQVTFTVDQTGFNAKEAELQGLATSDSGNNIYFVLIASHSKIEEKFPVTIAKIYRSDGLSWSHNFALDFIPSEIVYVQETGELALKSDVDKVALIDKAGKLK